MKTIGIYNPNLNTKGGGEKVCLALAEALADENDVILLTHHKINKIELGEYFGVDLRRVRVVVVKESVTLRRALNRIHLPDALNVTLKNIDLYRKFKAINLDIFVNNAYNTELPSPAPTGVYMCMFPHKLLDKDSMSPVKRFYSKSVDRLSKSLMFSDKKHWLDTYQIITANSAFTQRYITNYWNRESDILYPICDSMLTPGVEKKKIILNVGRFFHNNGITHHKRQDFLVDVFSDMKYLHQQGWELHFAGTVNENYPDMQYVLELLKRSENIPIYFHLDAPLARLKELYSQASLYWHATGYGSSPTKNPERQEHFGISTVESMSAGAIPVVISTAGQKEVVKDRINGYLWKTEMDLKTKTLDAIKSMDKISTAMFESAAKYDKRSFSESVKRIFQTTRHK